MKLSAILATLLILSGCATQPGYKPMPVAAAGQTKSIEAVLSIGQKELEADIVVSNTAAALAAAGLFGAIPAMAAAAVDASINSSRTKAAEAAVSPVRDALVDFNFNETARASLAAQLKAVSYASNTEVSVNTEVTNAEHEKRYSASKQDTVLFVQYSYRLSPDFGTLTMWSHANLYPNTEALRKLQMDLYGETSKLGQKDVQKALPVNSLYTHQMVFSTALDTVPADIEVGGKAWAEEGGRRARAALSEGASVLAQLLASDLAKPEQLTPASAKELLKRAPYTLQVEGKRYNVTQGPFGQSTVTAEKPAVASIANAK